MPAPGRRWLIALATIAAAGLAVRLVYVFAFENPAPLIGDSWYYHNAANLLADGKGFINPAFALQFGQGRFQSASQPPGYIVALAGASWLGFRSTLDHQVWSCLIGTATIGVVGLAGRRIAGARVGLIAAAIAAVYPNFWLNDGLVMSETLTLLTAALTVLASYRFLQRPGFTRAAVLGAAVGVLSLVRPEAMLMFPLLILPLTVILATGAWRRRVAFAATAIGVAMATLAPWVIYNQTRFDHPVFVTSSLGWTLVAANCDAAYHGESAGYWSYPCGAGPDIHGDESTVDIVMRRRAWRYLSAHTTDLPRVVALRLGRTFGLYRPHQQLTLDRREGGHPPGPATAGLLMYYALMPAAAAGAVILRRRKASMLPLVTFVALVVITVALAFGQTRYRAPAEVSIVLLASVAIDAALSAYVARAARPGPV